MTTECTRLAAAEAELAKRQQEVHAEAAKLEAERVEINRLKQLQEVRPGTFGECTRLWVVVTVTLKQESCSSQNAAW